MTTAHRSSAPKSRLQGEALDEAVRLREVENWSFSAIGKHFGVCEASASNAVTTALCVRRGYRPAERDQHGRLTVEGIERLRYALKKGLKGIDIQLRLGVSAACVSEQRRRYNRELLARGKALLPPPGGGQAYSGARLSPAKRKQVEQLFLQGLGTQKIAERTKLLSQLEQAKMQEQVSASLRSMSEIAAPGNTPSLEEIRDKIERRYANAMGSAELAQNSVQGRMLEVQQASVQMAGHDRLEQIKASMRGDALPAGGATVTPAAAAPEVTAAPDEPLSQ